MGRTHVSRGWSDLDAAGRLDVDKTALASYRLYEARPRNPAQPLIPNFPPFVALEETHEYNDYIAKLKQKEEKDVKAAREHYQVIKSYKRMPDNAVKCRKG
ncbi:hypothetical protein C8A00DRAFT_32948 [Chaetomidium leptoderma]|uniref:Uncharacterized protein n=1 Tax=Chaetomidium leptoderma TaxID=669021 RepID=A0AAN6VNZ9_9PEZI|nr:hypothetical protein C8A00DRAFT_32948 [Chaetomidium leptoderma]